MLLCNQEQWEILKLFLSIGRFLLFNNSSLILLLLLKLIFRNADIVEVQNDPLLLSLCKCSIFLTDVFIIYLREHLEEGGIRKDASMNPTLESNALSRDSLLEFPDIAKRGSCICITSTENFGDKTLKSLNIFDYMLIPSLVLEIKLVLTFGPGYIF